MLLVREPVIGLINHTLGDGCRWQLTKWNLNATQACGPRQEAHDGKAETHQFRSVTQRAPAPSDDGIGSIERGLPH